MVPSRDPLAVQDVLTGKPNGSASSPDPCLSSTSETLAPRKKRKVSFAPGPPTSFSHHDQPQETSRPESALRRNTRSSSQGKVTMKTLPDIAESSAEVPPAHTSGATGRTGGEEEKEEKGSSERLDLPSMSVEQLSDDESISSGASSVTSTGEGSSTPTVAPKRRGRPRKKVSLARDKVTAGGDTRVKEEGTKAVQPLASERMLKTVSMERKAAKGESQW